MDGGYEDCTDKSVYALAHDVPYGALIHLV